MKKPKLLLIGALALSSTHALAQKETSIGLKFPTQKGRWMLGSDLVIGEFAYNNTNSDYGVTGTYNLSFSPRAGYFIKDNLMVGGMINASFSGSSLPDGPFVVHHNEKIVGVGVFARRYFGKATNSQGELNKLRFFVEAGGSINKGWMNGPGEPSRTTFTTGNVYAMPGVCYFLTKNIALEGGLHLSHTFGPGNINGSADRIGAYVGLKIFLGKR